MAKSTKNNPWGITPEQIAKFDDVRNRLRAEGRLDAETTARQAQQFSLPVTAQERSDVLELMLALKSTTKEE